MINNPYVLFIRIPLVKNSDGHIYCDPLWEKDLRLHLNYIEKFGICCPIVYQDNTEGLIEISDLNIQWFFALKQDYGYMSILLNIIPNFITVIKACFKAKIVHSEGAGWAFPLSFYLLLLRPFFSFKWVILIESSFWMHEQGEKWTLRKLVNHYIHKFLLRQCVRLADAKIFTQSFYKKYFLGDSDEHTLINPATWIDKKNILNAETVKYRFSNRKDTTLKIIFPSRLIADKGVYIVLEAINKLHVEKQSLHITIMGAGELEQECINFIKHYNGNVDVIFMKTIEYGTQFFNMLTQYDYVLVPIIKQEQPRIIFDAFSQGVPVIGSDTPGIRDITNKDNAILFRRGDSSDLAETLNMILKNHSISLDMGLAGLEYVAEKTHFQMHKDRENFLNRILKI
jgi:glycosyltransferase involved in cell wall biosynthesis